MEASEQSRRPHMGKRSLSSKSRSSLRSTTSSSRHSSGRSLKKQGSASSRLSKRSKASSGSSTSGKHSLIPPSLRIDSGEDDEPLCSPGAEHSLRLPVRMVNRAPSGRSFQRAESNASLSTAAQELEFLFWRSCRTDCSLSTADSVRSLDQLQRQSSKNLVAAASFGEASSPWSPANKMTTPTTTPSRSFNRRSLMFRQHHSSTTLRSSETPPYLLRNTTQSSVKTNVLKDSSAQSTDDDDDDDDDDLGSPRPSKRNTRDAKAARTSPFRPDNPVALHLRKLQRKSTQSLSCRSPGARSTTLTRMNSSSSSVEHQRASGGAQPHVMMLRHASSSFLDEAVVVPLKPPPPQVTLLMVNREDDSTYSPSSISSSGNPRGADVQHQAETTTMTTTTTTTTTITTTIRPGVLQEQTTLVAVATADGGLWQPRNFAPYRGARGGGENNYNDNEHQDENDYSWHVS